MDEKWEERTLLKKKNEPFLHLCQPIMCTVFFSSFFNLIVLVCGLVCVRNKINRQTRAVQKLEDPKIDAFLSFSLSRPLSTWVYSIQKLLELQYLFVSIQLVYIRWSIHVYQRGFMENLAYPVYRANNASLFESGEGVVLHYTGSIDAIVTYTYTAFHSAALYFVTAKDIPGMQFSTHHRLCVYSLAAIIWNSRLAQFHGRVKR